MTQADAYTPPPAKTMDDIGKVADFIKARVDPLRDTAPFKSDQERSFQALLDLLVMLKASARSDIERGTDPAMQHFQLTIAASQWNDHPDFLPEWRP
ncbi:hypothetical protein ACGFZS_47285 [Streptomyces sp. NPDC048288]|uniref:hypothetical protein n=1 Tax=Streptomyces sp. NPDC048288 TaxID=3365529 RepID=UPI003712F141